MNLEKYLGIEKKKKTTQLLDIILDTRVLRYLTWLGYSQGIGDSRK